MCRILDEKLKEEFKKEFNVEADSIIIMLDVERKVASYVLDATIKIKEEYEKILKYYNK